MGDILPTRYSSSDPEEGGGGSGYGPECPDQNWGCDTVVAGGRVEDREPDSSEIRSTDHSPWPER